MLEGAPGVAFVVVVEVRVVEGVVGAGRREVVPVGKGGADLGEEKRSKDVAVAEEDVV